MSEDKYRVKFIAERRYTRFEVQRLEKAFFGLFTIWRIIDLFLVSSFGFEQAEKEANKFADECRKAEELS